MHIQRCEICGQTFLADYGYSLALSWLVTGHSYVRAFGCEEAGPSAQHWGCSIEHAIMAIQQCLNEHMHAGRLQEKHEATGKPRYADEHKVWAEGRGANFHFIEIVGGLP